MYISRVAIRRKSGVTSNIWSSRSRYWSDDKSVYFILYTKPLPIHIPVINIHLYIRKARVSHKIPHSARTSLYITPQKFIAGAHFYIIAKHRRTRAECPIPQSPIIVFWDVIQSERSELHLPASTPSPHNAIYSIYTRCAVGSLDISTAPTSPPQYRCCCCCWPPLVVRAHRVEGYTSLLCCCGSFSLFL